jgi:hypothetical protein
MSFGNNWKVIPEYPALTPISSRSCGAIIQSLSSSG